MKWPTTGKESYSTSSTSCRGSGAHYPNKTFFVLLRKLGVAAFKVTQFEVRSFPFCRSIPILYGNRCFPKELIPPTITRKKIFQMRRECRLAVPGLSAPAGVQESPLQTPPGPTSPPQPATSSHGRGGRFPAALGPAAAEEGAGGCAEGVGDGGRRCGMEGKLGLKGEA